MPADRAGYGSQQAELLNALQRGESYPAGFRSDDAAAASRALIDKRARAVRQAWPALSHTLDDTFSSAFARFARRTPPPETGGGLADGLAFACGLSQRALGDDARAEILLARAVITQRSAGPRLGRGFFVGAIRLRHPYRILIVMGLPGLGVRHVAVPDRHD